MQLFSYLISLNCNFGPFFCLTIKLIDKKNISIRHIEYFTQSLRERVLKYEIHLDYSFVKQKLKLKEIHSVQCIFDVK